MGWGLGVGLFRVFLERNVEGWKVEVVVFFRKEIFVVLIVWKFWLV